MFTVNLIHNKSFNCEDEQSIFEAAKSSGIILDHSCLKARCRSCLAKVLKGQVRSITKENILNDSERNEGFILTCNSIPLTNIDLKANSINNNDFHPVRSFPSKIYDLKFVTENLLELSLKIPPNLNFKFNAGQYLNLTFNDIKRSYSFSEPKIQNDIIKIFIKRYQNGRMSNYLFSDAKKNNLMRIEGPFGSFRFNLNHKENLIFIATGTGIAPIKSILEDIDNRNLNLNKTFVYLFWGNRELNEFNWSPTFKNLSISYFKVLSRPSPKWNGKIGYVQDAILSEKINLENSTVYACGSLKMIDQSLLLLSKNGLDKNHFYSDAFVTS